MKALPKQTPAMVRNALRRQRAVAMRAQGFTYQAIAQVLRFSGKGAAYNAVSAELDKTRTEAVQHLRQIQHERIEQIIKTIFPVCIAGPNTPAKMDCIKVFIALSSYLSRLLGLDVSRRAETDGGGAKAAASVQIINLVQLGKGGEVKDIKDLSDQELLALVSAENGETQKGVGKGAANEPLTR